MTNPKYSSVGYGTMNLTWREDPIPEEQAFATLKAAIEHGLTFVNAGELYGPDFRNIKLLGKFFKKYPQFKDVVTLSVKGGVDLDVKHAPDSSPEYLGKQIDLTLKYLDGKSIDTYMIARIDKTLPLEVPYKFLAKQKEEGKIGSITISEVSAETIRKAHAITPLSGCEVEVSLFTQDIFENGIYDTCKELGIPIVAYSPLSRGLIAPSLELGKNDLRANYPRFSAESKEHNAKAVAFFTDLAKKENITLVQFALAWVKAKGCIPIPGGTTPEKVIENAGALKVELSQETLAKVDEFFASFEVQGHRYEERSRTLLDE